MIELIKPNWPAPENICAFTTTRAGGVSAPPYHQLNLGAHVGDNARDVTKNRRLLAEQCRLPSEPVWLNQQHTTRILVVENAGDATSEAYDGSISEQENRVCVVLTADCLPVLLTDTYGRRVAAVHAGWRGLAEGIIHNAVALMQQNKTTTETSEPPQLLAWIGPAISRQHFEVGDEVRHAFVSKDNSVDAFFYRKSEGKWMADLPGIAKYWLEKLKVETYLSELCSFADSRFYSYRRDGETGRMATMIWRRPSC